MESSTKDEATKEREKNAKRMLIPKYRHYPLRQDPTTGILDSVTGAKYHRMPDGSLRKVTL